MQLYEMQVNKTAVFGTAPVRIPRGIIGAVVKLSFSAEWEGLTKTAVFRAGEVTKDVADIQDAVVIPAECTREEGELLQLGIYGVDAQGTVAIPTLWASIGRITEAADPSGDETTDPSLPVWAQVLEMVKQLEEQGVTQNEVEQAVKDFFGGALPAGRTTEEGGEIFNFYTDPVYTGDNPPKEFPGNTANKGSHAEGFSTDATGEYAHAEGWNSVASGGIAHAQGRETEASGYASHAEGQATVASGSNSHAEGNATKATASNSHAEGNKTEANAAASHAEGEGSKTEGMYAHAEGYQTLASGVAAHSEGVNTEASGYAAHAAGRGTKATCRYQSVRGAFNKADEEAYTDGRGNFADIVGGGSSDTDRKNIYTLDWDGNAEFAGKVYSGGVEVAPGGFGLGVNVTQAPGEDWNNATKTGWFCAKYNAPVENDWYFGEVIRYADYCIIQKVCRAFNTADETSYHISAERRGHSNDGGVTFTFGEWEWVNPPMIEGVEYRTTKRHSGNPIYKKRLGFGVLPDGTTEKAGVKEVEIGVDASKIMEFSGYAYKSGETNPLPLGYMGAFGAYAYINGTKIGISTMNTLSGYQAIFYLEYIK